MDSPSASTVKQTRKFIITMFVIGGILGLVSATAYALYVKGSGKWEPSTSAFHTGVLFWGLGFMFPSLAISLRIMFRSLVLGEEGIASTRELKDGFHKMQSRVEPMADKIEKVADKAIPIAEKVEKILENLELVAEKAKATAEKMNGGIDLKALEGEMKVCSEALKKIAEHIEKNPLMAALSEPEIPDFDPATTASTPRRRSRHT